MMEARTVHTQTISLLSMMDLMTLYPVRTIDGTESKVHDEQEKPDNGGSLCHFHPTDTILEIKSVITEPCMLQKKREGERKRRRECSWTQRGKLTLVRFILQLLVNHVQCTCGSNGNDPAKIPGIAFDLSQTIAHAYTTKSVQHCENAQNQWYF